MIKSLLKVHFKKFILSKNITVVINAIILYIFCTNNIVNEVLNRE